MGFIDCLVECVEENGLDNFWACFAACSIQFPDEVAGIKPPVPPPSTPTGQPATPTPPVPPPQPPPVPAGWKPGSVISEDLTQLRCTEYTYLVPAGATARFRISDNEAGTTSGTVKFKVNDKEVGPITGNGALPPVAGPATVVVHLTGDEDACRLDITVPE